MTRPALTLALLCVAACSVKIGGDGETPGDFPCDAAEQCPASESPCLLSTCLDGQCAYVPAPDGLLHEASQQAGDCKLVYCDGQGRADERAAASDLPPDDDNPCTKALCDVDRPVHRALATGSRCGSDGVCNGAGSCGVCLPKALQCTAERGDDAGAQVCGSDGQWSAATPCGSAAPRCAAGRCVGIAELAVGRAHACVRFDDGAVFCWGDDGAGQLGGTDPEQVSLWTPFRSMDLGDGHGCGIAHDGAVWCWGAGDRGQLGHGGLASHAGPFATGLSGASQVAVGHEHSCALVAGEVFCWGRNDAGQCGVLNGKGRAMVRDAPSPGPGRARPENAAPDVAAQSLSLLGDATCAHRDGVVRCWGWIDFELPEPIEPAEGERPTAEQRRLIRERKHSSVLSPQKVAGVQGAVQVAAGGDHSCALLGDGSVICWGAAEQRQHGHAAAIASKPVTVPGLSGVTRIALGRRFGCARSGSEVWCWGDNAAGQLGTGADDSAHEARKLASLPPSASLALGDDFACALSSDGRVHCWGDNAAGQLGREPELASSRTPLPLAW